jgi:hypothetical protein
MIYLTPLTTTTPEERRREIGKNRYTENQLEIGKPNHRINCSAVNHHHAEIGKPNHRINHHQPLTTTTPRSGSPSHRINHHHAGKPKPPPNQPVSCFNRKPKRPKEQREKREQREERANEKKREIFGRNERRERKIRNKYQLVGGGVRSEKYWFFNFYKVYSSLSFLKGYCTLCKKI